MYRRITFADLISRIINFIFGLIVLGLFIRLALRLFGANAEAPFVEFIYNSTAPLLHPFNNIFNSLAISNQGVLESSTLVAIIFYLLIAYIIDAFIDFIAFNTKRYRIVN